MFSVDDAAAEEEERQVIDVRGHLLPFLYSEAASDRARDLSSAATTNNLYRSTMPVLELRCCTSPTCARRLATRLSGCTSR